jgi:hypothetical protein
MSEIIKAKFNKNYQVELAMRDAIRDAIYEFEGQISLVSTLGILELVKAELIQEG